MFGCFFGHQWQFLARDEFRDDSRYERVVIAADYCARCGAVQRAIVESNVPSHFLAMHKWIFFPPDEAEQWMKARGHKIPFKQKEQGNAE